MPRPFNLKKVLSPVQDIVRKLKDRRDKLLEEVNEINSHLTALGGKGRRRGGMSGGETDAGNGAQAGSKRKGKRTRRSRAELVAMATGVVEFIKSKGKDGVGAKEIQAKFGSMAPSVNNWLKQYSPVKVKTSGEKSRMKYFA